MGTSSIFTPDNEPYLGRVPIWLFDEMLPLTIRNWQSVERHVRRKNDLSDIEMAAVNLFPATISLATSVRELLRQGYIFGAVTLLRPLVERAFTLAHLEKHRELLEEWKAGWRYRKRPDLKTMVQGIEFDWSNEGENPFNYLNRYIHADPASIDLVFRSDGDDYGFIVTKDLSNPAKCDEAAMIALSGMLIAKNTSSKIWADELKRD